MHVGLKSSRELVFERKYIMTDGIQKIADYRQTYKAKHYINSLKHVYEVLKLA
jgi:hypothetical protein